MKIALVSPYDYPYPGAVTEHISYLNRHFEQAGHEVRILAPSSHDDVEERMQHVYRVGKRIIGVPANQSIARITLSLNLSRAVKRILKAENFDVIHLHEPLVPALSPTVLRRSRAVNIGTFHASRRKYFGYYYGRPLLKRYIRRIHGRICVSNAARDFVSHYFPGDYRIIPNGVDVDAFRVQRPLFPELNDGKLTMLFVGRLEKRKGLVYLLHALPYVQHHFPQLRLIVVGAFDEEDMREYRQVVAELGLRDVVFKGFVSTEDKLRYYQMCDLFVSPALGRESQGIVLLEAMAAGKPVIASDIDGYRARLAPRLRRATGPTGESRCAGRRHCPPVQRPGVARGDGAASTGASARLRLAHRRAPAARLLRRNHRTAATAPPPAAHGLADHVERRVTAPG